MASRLVVIGDGVAKLARSQGNSAYATKRETGRTKRYLVTLKLDIELLALSIFLADNTEIQSIM